jgi:hypothetical protein
LGAAHRAAYTLLRDGTYDAFEGALPFPDVNGSFSRA